MPLDLHGRVFRHAQRRELLAALTRQAPLLPGTDILDVPGIGGKGRWTWVSRRWLRRPRADYTQASDLRRSSDLESRRRFGSCTTIGSAGRELLLCGATGSVSPRRYYHYTTNEGSVRVRTPIRIGVLATTAAAGLMAFGAPAFADSTGDNGINLLNGSNLSVLPIQACNDLGLPLGSPQTTSSCVKACDEPPGSLTQPRSRQMARAPPRRRLPAGARRNPCGKTTIGVGEDHTTI
jgi:hypothetical protein